MDRRSRARRFVCLSNRNAIEIHPLETFVTVARERQQAVARRKVERLFETLTLVRVLLAHLARRARDPLLAAATAIMRE